MSSRQPERCIPHVQEVFGGSRPVHHPPPSAKQVADSTVGERELKHIEKRMSMKKTIRKQISRQLAQAFVENPELSRDERLDCNRNDRHAHNLTLTKCKMLAKMDANVLDLLRRAEEVAPALDHQNHQNQASSGDALTAAKHGDKKPSLWKRLWSNKR